MTRDDFQNLALERLADAKALLTAKRWSAAYYLAGYAVECAFKSCVVGRIAATAHLIFEDRKFSERYSTRNLTQLVELAGVGALLKGDLQADPQLSSNWKTVRRWTEASRYERKSKADAEVLYAAITDKKHGVFPWIKRQW